MCKYVLSISCCVLLRKNLGIAEFIMLSSSTEASDQISKQAIESLLSQRYA